MCATTSQNYSKKISVATTVLSIPVLLSLSLILTGCQGVNSSASNAGTTNTAITLNQTSVNLAEGGTTQFSATVQNAASNSVNWSVDGVGGGNSTVGKITASGLYTAPMAAGAHTVTAAVASVPSVTAQATVAVGSTTVTPSSVLVGPSGTEQFTATVQGFSNTAVTWALGAG